MPEAVWLLGGVAQDPILDHIAGLCRRLGVKAVECNGDLCPEIGIDHIGQLSIGDDVRPPGAVFNRLRLGGLPHVSKRPFDRSQWGAYWAAVAAAMPPSTFNMPRPNALLGCSTEPTYVRGRLAASGIATAKEHVAYSLDELRTAIAQNRILYCRPAGGGSVIIQQVYTEYHLRHIRFPVVFISCQSMPTIAMHLSGLTAIRQSYGKWAFSEHVLIKNSLDRLSIKWGTIIYIDNSPTEIINVMPYIPDELTGEFIDIFENKIIQIVSECGT